MARYLYCLLLSFFVVPTVFAFDSEDPLGLDKYNKNPQHQEDLKKYSDGFSLDTIDSYYKEKQNQGDNGSGCQHMVTPDRHGRHGSIITVISGFTGVKSVAVSRSLHISGKNFTLPNRLCWKVPLK